MARSKASRAAQLQVAKQVPDRSDLPPELDELEGALDANASEDDDNHDADGDGDEDYQEPGINERNPEEEEYAQPEQGEEKPKKRKRASAASTGTGSGKSRVLNCENCRSRKMKIYPCSNCSIRNIVCEWVAPPPPPPEQSVAGAVNAEIVQLRAEIKILTARLQLTPEQVEEITREADQILKDEQGIEPLRQAKPPVPRQRRPGDPAPKPPASKRVKNASTTATEGGEPVAVTAPVEPHKSKSPPLYKRGFSTGGWGPEWHEKPDSVSSPGDPIIGGSPRRSTRTTDHHQEAWTGESGVSGGDNTAQALYRLSGLPALSNPSNSTATSNTIIDEALAALVSTFPPSTGPRQGFAPPRSAPSPSTSSQLSSALGAGTLDSSKNGLPINLPPQIPVAFPTSSSRGSAPPPLPPPGPIKNWFETAEGQAETGDIVVDSNGDVLV